MQAIITLYNLEIAAKPSSSTSSCNLKDSLKGRSQSDKDFSLICGIFFTRLSWAGVYQKIICQLDMCYTCFMNPQGWISYYHVSSRCYSYLVYRGKSQICFIDSYIYLFVSTPPVMIYFYGSDISINNESNSSIIPCLLSDIRVTFSQHKKPGLTLITFHCDVEILPVTCLMSLS